MPINYYKSITLNGSQLKTVEAGAAVGQESGSWAPGTGVGGTINAPSFIVDQAGTVTTTSTIDAGGDITTTADINGVNGVFSTDVSAATFTGGTFSGSSLTVSGAVSTGTLAVTSNATIGGDLGVTGDTTLTGDLDVSGSTTLAGLTAGATTLQSVSVTANASVGGDFSVTGDSTLTGDLDVSGSTTLAGLTAGATTLQSVSVTANASVGGDLGVTGDTTLTGDLDVSGATTLAGLTAGATTLQSVSVTANATVGGDLGVTGDTTLTGDLDVSGATTLTAVTAGAINCTSLTATNAVTGGSLTDGTLTIATGAITNGVSAAFSGAVTAGSVTATGAVTGGSLTDGTLTIASGSISSGVNAAFSGTVSAGAFSGGTFSGSTVTTTGDVNVGGDLDVTGDSTLGGDLDVSGTTTLVGLTVSGPANLSTAITSGDLTVGGDLTVTGDIVSRGQTEVVVSDAFLELANGNDSTSAVSAGYAATIARNSDIVYFVQEFESQATSSSANAKLIFSTDGTDIDSTRLSGSINFGGGQPSASDTLAFDLPGGGTATFTYVASSTNVATEIFRGNNLQEAVENTVAKLNAYTDSGNRQFRAQYNAENSFSSGGTAQMLIQYDRQQTAGGGVIDISGMTSGTVTSKFDFSNIPRIQVGQIIQVAQQDANEANGGLFVVAATSANTVELANSPAAYIPFAQNNVQDATEEPNARPKVSFVDLYVQAVSNGVLSDSNGPIAEGVLCQGYEEFATEASFNGGYNEIGAGTVTLQNAYENGPTLTTNSTIGDLEISGTEDVSITSTGSNSKISIGATNVQTSVSMYAGEALAANQAVAVSTGVLRSAVTVAGVPAAGDRFELVDFDGDTYRIEFNSGGGTTNAFAGSGPAIATSILIFKLPLMPLQHKFKQSMPLLLR